MPGRLTTHILDTAGGQPAGGVDIELVRLDASSGQRQVINTARTNADGRTDAPLLEGDALTAGTYELLFAVGDYFVRQGHESGPPPFLDVVPIRFGISDTTRHYHIPLLASPWSYTTYRGS